MVSEVDIARKLAHLLDGPRPPGRGDDRGGERGNRSGLNRVYKPGDIC